MDLMQEMKSKVRGEMARLFYGSNIHRALHRGKVLILAYHRVLSQKELDRGYVQPGMYVLKQVFEDHIRFLKTEYRMLSFSELLERFSRNGIEKKERYCVVTLDDGWRDNYQYAYPILKTYQVPATIFLPTSFIGTCRWFWTDQLGDLLWRYHFGPLNGGGRSVSPRPGRRLWDGLGRNGKRAGGVERIDRIIERYKSFPPDEVSRLIAETCRELRLDLPDHRLFLDWSEVEEMSENGISFGSHSRTHRILTHLSAKEIGRELEESLNTLQQKNINDIPVFCYPNGNCTHDIFRRVRAAGYRAAIGGRFGVEGDQPGDLFSLKRIGVHQDVCATLPLFTFHVSGMNHWGRRVKNG